MTTAAAQRRFDFLAETIAPVNDHVKEKGTLPDPATSPIYNEIIDKISQEGPALGRTDRWKAACAWLATEREAGYPLDWIVLQGSVYLNFAVE